ncbi:MAG: 3'-5' exonuclease [Xanthobacteraceae bacterium]|nr:3'-5' exonuclease [Xanthobacteraceae bacterium]MBV9238005.1 3'-5' exonuclease [Xanthobacteraceae bacterium]MBV9631661.1 3'-5' exonuclease [Xanthobacteraceae bacterium]
MSALTRALWCKIGPVLLADSRYRFLFEKDDSGELVSLDCETTGFNYVADDVISIAAIKIRGTRILARESFQAVIRPGAPMEASAIKVHQLRQQDLAQAGTIREVLPDFLRFIGSRPLVGYWIAFDVRMLNKYLFSLLNVHLPNRQIDVSELYYERKYAAAPPGTMVDLRYASIMADLGLPALPQHDAFADAVGAAEIYLVLEDLRRRGVRLPRKAIEAATDFQLA